MILAYEAVIQPVMGPNGDTIFHAPYSNFWCNVIASTEQEANDAIVEFKAKRGDRKAILRSERIATRSVDFVTNTIEWRASVRFLRFNDEVGNLEQEQISFEPLYYGFSKAEQTK